MAEQRLKNNEVTYEVDILRDDNDTLREKLDGAEAREAQWEERYNEACNALEEADHKINAEKEEKTALRAKLRRAEEERNRLRRLTWGKQQRWEERGHKHYRRPQHHGDPPVPRHPHNLQRGGHPQHDTFPDTHYPQWQPCPGQHHSAPPYPAAPGSPEYPYIWD